MSLLHPAASQEDELPPGTSVCDGRFVVQATIGQGGVAKVYLVRDDRGHRYALKVMHERRASDPAQCERFDNEARFLAALADAPYVVKALEAGRLTRPPGRPYIAMELLRGPTLDWLVHVQRAKPKVQIRRVCTIVRAVADALADLHARGIVHRDIKPDNIAVEGHGRIKLLDFGYAHSDGIGAMPNTAGLTLAEHRPGTYLYMAPEQTIGKPPAPSFDIYALAVTLYEALAGEAPHQRLPVAEMARRKCEVREPEISIEGRVFGLPRALVELVDHGLKRLPIERVASASEFRDRLDRILDDLPQEDDPDLELAIQRRSALGVLEPPSAVETDRAPRSLGLAGGKAEVPPLVVARPGQGQERGRVVPIIVARTELAPVAQPVPASTRPPIPAAASGRRWGWRVAVPLLVAGALVVGWHALQSDEAVDQVEAAAQSELAVAGVDSDGASEAGPAPPGAAFDATASPEDTTSDGTDSGDVLDTDDQGPSPEISSITTDGPEPVARPTKPRASRTPAPCPDVSQQATQAAAERDWSQVLALTRSRRCWDDTAQREWLRVTALKELGKYAECVDVGSRSSSKRVAPLVGYCKAMVKDEDDRP